MNSNIQPQIQSDSEPYKTTYSTYKKDRYRDIQTQAFRQIFYEQTGYIILKEITDRSNQHKGIDLVLLAPDGQIIYVDEKCSTSEQYLEHGLKTYLQELQFRQRTSSGIKTFPGWAIDPTKETTHYALFVMRGKSRDNLITEISKITGYIVSKKAITEYIARFGFSMEELLEIFQTLPENKKYHDPHNPQKSFIHISEKNLNGQFEILQNRPINVPTIKIVQSNQLFEQPINIPIPLTDIRQIADTSLETTFTPEESAQLLSLTPPFNVYTKTLQS